jgi:ankyrin repeat protein
MVSLLSSIFISNMIHKFRLGQVQAIEELVRLGTPVDILTQDWGGETPLYKAASNGKLPAIKSLVKYGAQVNSTNMENLSLLHWLVKRDGILEGVLSTLVQLGADVNVRANTDIGVTPLYMAAQGGKEEYVRELVKMGADVDLFCGQYNPLHIATASGKLGAVKALIAAGAKLDLPTQNNDKITPLCLAICYNQKEIFNNLLKLGANPNIVGKTLSPVLAAVLQDKAELLKVLAKAGANVVESKIPNVKHPPIYYAVAQKNLSCVKELIKLGAKVNDALLRQTDDPDILKVLRKAAPPSASAK